MAIEDSEEADLRPLDVEVLLVLGLQDVQNDGDAVFVVIPYDSLIGVGSVALDDSTLLLAGLRWLMILQLDRLWIEWRWVLAEEQGLHLDELDVGVLLLLARQWCWNLEAVAVLYALLLD